MASSLILAALADDFTGAVELAAMLRSGGARTRLVVGPAAIPANIGDDQALVVALRSRVAPPGEAAAAAEEAMERLRPHQPRMLFL